MACPRRPWAAHSPCFDDPIFSRATAVRGVAGHRGPAGRGPGSEQRTSRGVLRLHAHRRDRQTPDRGRRDRHTRKPHPLRGYAARAACQPRGSPRRHRHQPRGRIRGAGAHRHPRPPRDRAQPARSRGRAPPHALRRRDRRPRHGRRRPRARLARAGLQTRPDPRTGRVLLRSDGGPVLLRRSATAVIGGGRARRPRALDAIDHARVGSRHRRCTREGDVRDRHQDLRESRARGSAEHHFRSSASGHEGLGAQHGLPDPPSAGRAERCGRDLARLSPRVGGDVGGSRRVPPRPDTPVRKPRRSFDRLHRTVRGDARQRHDPRRYAGHVRSRRGGSGQPSCRPMRPRFRAVTRQAGG
jgi:hypothetical protein